MEHHELLNLLHDNGLEVPAERLALLRRYVTGLLQWNGRVNLISRRGEEDIWSAHIVHSISPLFLLKIPHGVNILDLGTGGGLPGIPLAIVHGGLSVVLLDSIQKKIFAVQSIIDELNLPMVSTVAARAEDLARVPGNSGKYDIVVARGVAPLHELIRWARPLLARRRRTGTRRRHLVPGDRNEFQFPYLLAYKGGDLGAELRKAHLRSEGVSITEIGISFKGSHRLGLVEKKLVVVEFH